jgi:hypothetical protein
MMLVEAIPNLRVKTAAIGLRSLVRFAMLAVIPIYCASFQWSYVKWIAPVWGYMGPRYRSPDPILLLLAYILAILLCALSPLKLRRPSQVIYWILYFSVYIPGLFIPLFMQLDNGFTLLLLELSLTGGMLLIALSYRIKLANIRSYPIDRKMFWTIFYICFVLMNLALLAVFRGNLQFASLGEVYDVRAKAGEVAQQNVGITYISTLLGNVMNPFLIAYGFSTHRRKLVALGTLGQILVYSTAAMKIILLSPPLIFLIYYSVNKDRGGWVPKLGLLGSAAFIVLTALAVGRNAGLFFTLASIILFRSFALPGTFIGYYQYFFENFPHTYLSHIHGVNLFVSDPYSMSLGLEIGVFYQGVGSLGRIGNANANFFAMDGIAGFGLPGILIMGVICAAMFWLLDGCARKYTVAFSASALICCTMSLANSSLFTSFLGGGIMLFMLLFLLIPQR